MQVEVREGAAWAAAAWPATVQPFFLSAVSVDLTPADAAYIGRFPLAVINHKQGSSVPSGAEEKQLRARESTIPLIPLSSQLAQSP
jgi:hypothetical protein